MLLKRGNLYKEIENKENETQYKIEYNIMNLKEVIGINDKFNVS